MISENFLQSNGFIVTVNRLPNVAYWCQSVTLPGISVTNPEQVNPFSRLPVPGDRPDFENLVIQFSVDENLRNWSELMRWMVGFSFPEDFAQFEFGTLDSQGISPGTSNNFYADISITVLTSHKNPLATFTYYNCIPTNISGIDLSVTNSDISPIVCTATFDFSHFTISKPSSTELIDILTTS